MTKKEAKNLAQRINEEEDEEVQAMEALMMNGSYLVIVTFGSGLSIGLEAPGQWKFFKALRQMSAEEQATIDQMKEEEDRYWTRLHLAQVAVNQCLYEEGMGSLHLGRYGYEADKPGIRLKDLPSEHG